MAREDQLDELMEQVLETGRTPEDVCAAHPDLLDEVRSRLRILKQVEAQLDSLFPSATSGAKTLARSPAHFDTALPTVPGYEVQSVLGRGGMGIVYQAKQLKLNRGVALKMLLTGSYASRQEHLRFVREAESVAALGHPNIVQIYELGEVDGHLFYTMEFVVGGSLAEKLEGKIQPARDAAKLVSALARAVQAAHEAGIVHRDLKPANVLLAEDGTPKITDFGLARRLDQDSNLTNTGARIGTPSYMAPEQMSGGSSTLGPAVDVFALGAILYEMLTGRPPFRGDSISDTERKLATEEPAPPSRFNPKVPRDLVTICFKCLEKDPRARYASATALAADLERFLAHEPIQARPVAPAERAMRWVRRNPLPTALAVAFAVLIGLTVRQVLDDRHEAAAQIAEKARLTSRLESGLELVQDGRFAEASTLLGKLGDGGFEDLRQRIDRALTDLKLVEKLEAIGVKRSMALDAPDATWLPNRRARAEYEAQFVAAELGKPADDPAAVARRIDASDIAQPLVAALDDWAVCEADVPRRDWVLDVACRASPPGDAWDNRCRDPATWADRDVLARLAETAPLATSSVQLLRALAERLAAAGLAATSFCTRVQEVHVNSFLANLSLADALRPVDPAEAIRYYQAALAIRPESATAHNNLAVALMHLERPDEAIAHYEQSLELDPHSAAGNYNLALALAGREPDEAIKHLQRAIELSPELAGPQRALGELYLKAGRHAEAKAALLKCRPLLVDDVARGEVDKLMEACDAANPPAAEP